MIKLSRNIIHKIENKMDTRKELLFEVLPLERVKSIGAKAIMLNKGIMLNDSTAVVENGDKMIIFSDVPVEFYNYYEISKIANDENMSIHEKIMLGIGSLASWGVFERTKFKSIDLTNTNCSTLTDMTRMFEQCSAWRLHLENADLTNVRVMHNTFAYTGIVELDFSKIKLGDNLTDITGLFQNATLMCFNIRNEKLFNAFRNYDKNREYIWDNPGILKCVKDEKTRLYASEQNAPIFDTTTIKNKELNGMQFIVTYGGYMGIESYRLDINYTKRHYSLMGVARAIMGQSL